MDSESLVLCSGSLELCHVVVLRPFKIGTKESDHFSKLQTEFPQNAHFFTPIKNMFELQYGANFQLYFSCSSQYKVMLQASPTRIRCINGAANLQSICAGSVVSILTVLCAYCTVLSGTQTRSHHMFLLSLYSKCCPLTMVVAWTAARKLHFIASKCYNSTWMAWQKWQFTKYL